MLSITGWRIGYIITDVEHMRVIRGIHDYTGLSAATLFQRAIALYLEENNYAEDYTSSLRDKCKQSYLFLRTSLEEMLFQVPDIQGGYFLWAKLPVRYTDALDFAEALYNAQKVAVVPGENFSPNKRNYIRLNYATEIGIIENAVKSLRAFFQ